ncbi:uncharacterized protein BO97DRAFT_455850 [Aspergillus homomorphus CBS 101889]|uniref:Uncharacterized protein n=1 Tax=Aspergillus homomorphus (strain CBS 101889) TaxID=1450537 RepID=A0A395I8G3_ASPHC|nr:hypothetical protein BO97DRAFT_455850 [Aspergillus homomorphus CBS 101889]RAL16341.1 hypothetical protein BO97DRAFT_455850 [Aspergillus homomorphus CBS 101889]
MHHHPSQRLPGTPLARLSIVKFSHVTTSLTHSGPLNWSHLIGNNDLIATFERSQSAKLMSESIILRIFRFQDTMEELDLSFCAIDAASISAQTSPTQASKPVFAVVVKPPCLAVKYPRGNMIRRFQIKFSAERDYYAALAILSEINCPFSEANAAPTRKHTSSQWDPGSFRPSHPYCATHTNRTLASYMPMNGNLKQPLEGQLLPPALQDQASPEGDPSRPSTATLTHEIPSLDPPPVRVLPFARPLAKRAHTITTASDMPALGSRGRGDPQSNSHATLTSPLLVPSLHPAPTGLPPTSNQTQPLLSKPSTSTPTDTPRVIVLRYANPPAQDQSPVTTANSPQAHPVPVASKTPVPRHSDRTTVPVSISASDPSHEQHQTHNTRGPTMENNIPSITKTAAAAAAAEIPQRDPPHESPYLATREDLASYGSTSTTERMQLVEAWTWRAYGGEWSWGWARGAREVPGVGCSRDIPIFQDMCRL